MLFLIQALLTFLPSAIKIPIYRLLGAEIGPGAKIGVLTFVAAKKIKLGPGCKIAPLTIIVGLRELQVDAFATIGYLTIANGPGRLHLACRAHLGSLCMLDLTDDISIGEYTGIGPRTTFITHTIQRPESWGYKSTRAPIVVGDMVHGGSNVMIGQGVNVASDVLLMPGSIILKEIKSNGLVFVTPDRTLALPQMFAKKTKLTSADLSEYIKKAIQVLENAKLEVPTPYIVPYGGEAPSLAKLRQGSWIWGANLPDEVFARAEGKYFVLDFYRLLSTEQNSKAAKKAMLVLKKTQGYRFLPFTYRGESKLVPPPIEF